MKDLYQGRLFHIPVQGPEGFRYTPDFITEDEELMLLRVFNAIDLINYTYKEYESKRRVRGFTKERGFPKFLMPFLNRVAKFGDFPLRTLEHALITEYTPGTAIGWHRDQGPYTRIIGISLGSSVPFRLRKRAGNTWERFTVAAAPRSLYIMSGASRSLWQHSIPPVDYLRYSLTMRTVG